MISEEDAAADEKTPTAMSEASLDERHAEKMAKKKAARDRIMATKSGEKGLIIVHTGAGKGKSSSAFGMIVRCVAHGFPCAVVQFIKGAWETGERRLLTGHFGDLCQFHAMGEGFTWETQDRARDIAAAQAGWEKAKQLIADAALRMVVLDEINIALRYDYLDIGEVVEFLKTPEAADDPCRAHRAQRQAGIDRRRRSRHRDDAGQASVPLRHQGAARRRVLTNETRIKIDGPRIDDPGSRLERGQVAHRRRPCARRCSPRPSRVAIQAAEHVEQRGRDG